MIGELASLPEYQHVFLSPSDALVAADPSSLLVVVDTNRPEQVLSQDLLEAVNKVAVIDHHRRAASYIQGAALSFLEPYASSASELVTELLQYILDPADLLRREAEALMAGIILDSKNFTLRTGSRTFDAAAFLRRAKADTTEVRRFFRSDLQQTVARYEIMKEAQTYREGIAVAALDHPADRVTAAQAADELLTISGIRASFVLFPTEDDRVILSGRSLGDTNVQVILEGLGGGGNVAVAGAQISGKSVSQVKTELLAAIDKYCDNK
jgi:c-di-AMP phosphodiesterase-like protein